MVVLSIDGKEPEEKEKTNKSARCLEISCFRRVKILFGILEGPLALFMLREDIMLAISSLSVGWINVELVHWCFKYSEKFYKKNQCSALQYQQLRLNSCERR